MWFLWSVVLLLIRPYSLIFKHIAIRTNWKINLLFRFVHKTSERVTNDQNFNQKRIWEKTGYFQFTQISKRKTKNTELNPILPFIKWTNIYVKSQMSKVVIHLSLSVHIKHAVVLAIKIPHSWKGMQNKQTNVCYR